MTENKMYPERPPNGNIPVMRFCDFNCIYCGFQKFLCLSKCQDCRDNKNHSHLEVLNRTPPKTTIDQFLTVGLSGDVSFMHLNEFAVVLGYCHDWNSRTFLIQSKNPSYFLPFNHMIPPNVIIGTTIETESDIFLTDHNTTYYKNISSAPTPYNRITAMLELTCRKAVIIEPILEFDLRIFTELIKGIKPEFVYVGYANDHKSGMGLKLPEPSIEKTMQLISGLRNAGICVREKTLRKAWYEE